MLVPWRSSHCSHICIFVCICSHEVYMWNRSQFAPDIDRYYGKGNAGRLLRYHFVIQEAYDISFMLLSAVAEGIADDFVLHLNWGWLRASTWAMTSADGLLNPATSKWLVFLSLWEPMPMPGTGSGAPCSLSPHPNWDMIPLMLSSSANLG